LLKVRVAELNRTALRQIGSDFLAVDHDTGAIVGTQIGGAGSFASGVIQPAGAITTTGSTILSSTGGPHIAGTASLTAGPLTSAFGIFQKGDFEFLLSALR